MSNRNTINNSIQRALTVNELNALIPNVNKLQKITNTTTGKNITENVKSNLKNKIKEAREKLLKETEKLIEDSNDINYLNSLRVTINQSQSLTDVEKEEFKDLIDPKLVQLILKESENKIYKYNNLYCVLATEIDESNGLYILGNTFIIPIREIDETNKILKYTTYDSMTDSNDIIELNQNVINISKNIKFQSITNKLSEYKKMEFNVDDVVKYNNSLFYIKYIDNDLNDQFKVKFKLRDYKGNIAPKKYISIIECQKFDIMAPNPLYSKGQTVYIKNSYDSYLVKDVKLKSNKTYSYNLNNRTTSNNITINEDNLTNNYSKLKVNKNSLNTSILPKAKSNLTSLFGKYKKSEILKKKGNFNNNFYIVLKRNPFIVGKYNIATSTFKELKGTRNENDYIPMNKFELKKLNEVIVRNNKTRTIRNINSVVKNSYGKIIGYKLEKMSGKNNESRIYKINELIPNSQQKRLDKEKANANELARKKAKENAQKKISIGNSVKIKTDPAGYIGRIKDIKTSLLSGPTYIVDVKGNPKQYKQSQIEKYIVKIK